MYPNFLHRDREWKVIECSYGNHKSCKQKCNSVRTTRGKKKKSRKKHKKSTTDKEESSPVEKQRHHDDKVGKIATHEHNRRRRSRHHKDLAKDHKHRHHHFRLVDQHEAGVPNHRRHHQGRKHHSSHKHNHEKEKLSNKEESQHHTLHKYHKMKHHLNKLADTIETGPDEAKQEPSPVQQPSLPENNVKDSPYTIDTDTLPTRILSPGYIADPSTYNPWLLGNILQRRANIPLGSVQPLPAKSIVSPVESSQPKKSKPAKKAKSPSPANQAPTQDPVKNFHTNLFQQLQHIAQTNQPVWYGYGHSPPTYTYQTQHIQDPQNPYSGMTPVQTPFQVLSGLTHQPVTVHHAIELKDNPNAKTHGDIVLHPPHLPPLSQLRPVLPNKLLVPAQPVGPPAVLPHKLLVPSPPFSPPAVLPHKVIVPSQPVGPPVVLPHFGLPPAIPLQWKYPNWLNILQMIQNPLTKMSSADREWWLNALLGAAHNLHYHVPVGDSSPETGYDWLLNYLQRSPVEIHHHVPGHTHNSNGEYDGYKNEHSQEKPSHIHIYLHDNEPQEQPHEEDLAKKIQQILEVLSKNSKVHYHEAPTEVISPHSGSQREDDLVKRFQRLVDKLPKNSEFRYHIIPKQSKETTSTGPDNSSLRQQRYEELVKMIQRLEEKLPRNPETSYHSAPKHIEESASDSEKLRIEDERIRKLIDNLPKNSEVHYHLSPKSSSEFTYTNPDSQVHPIEQLQSNLPKNDAELHYNKPPRDNHVHIKTGVPKRTPEMSTKLSGSDYPPQQASRTVEHGKDYETRYKELLEKLEKIFPKQQTRIDNHTPLGKAALDKSVLV